MTIDRLLSALEEYFSLKMEIGRFECDSSVEPHILEDARFRAKMALNEHIRKQFDLAIEEERRRTSSVTRKMLIVDPTKAEISWDSVAKLLDALNSPPLPMKNITNIEGIKTWMKAYEDWYKQKRVNAIKSTSSMLKLDLED